MNLRLGDVVDTPLGRGVVFRLAPEVRRVWVRYADRVCCWGFAAVSPAVAESQADEPALVKTPEVPR